MSESSPSAGTTTERAPLLDDWFGQRAAQDDKRNVVRILVAVDDWGIAGFYSLSAFTLSLTAIPEELARKLPRNDAPPPPP